MLCTPAGHPGLHLSASSWQTRRHRTMVGALLELLPHVAAAVEHATGSVLPLTVVSIDSPANAAWLIETGAHRSHLGAQPLSRLLKHVLGSWWALRGHQARTVQYADSSIQIFLNPQRLRGIKETELVRVLGHELVHAVQLAHPASTGYGADLANNYGINRYTPRRAADADAVVALHEAAAYRLEPVIVEATRWHREGRLPSPTLNRDINPVQPVTDLVRLVDSLTSNPLLFQAQRMLEELRDAAPAAALADLVDYLAGELQEMGQRLVVDRLEQARRNLTAASELLVESSEPNFEGFLRSVGCDPMHTFQPGDVAAIAMPDPVSIVPALTAP